MVLKKYGCDCCCTHLSCPYTGWRHGLPAPSISHGNDFWPSGSSAESTWIDIDPPAAETRSCTAWAIVCRRPALRSNLAKVLFLALDRPKRTDALLLRDAVVPADLEGMASTAVLTSPTIGLAAANIAFCLSLI